MKRSILRNFIIQLIIRVTLTVALLTAASVLLFSDSALFIWQFTITVSGLYSFYSLLKYVTETNRHITRFLSSMKYSDFSVSYSSMPHSAGFTELSDALSEITGDFRQLREKSEADSRYYQTILQHIATGILVIDYYGEVRLFNKAVKKILGINTIKSLDTISKVSSEMRDTLDTMKAGDRVLVDIESTFNRKKLSVFMTEIKMQDTMLKLFTIQDIQGELEENEMEAWQKIIRVLTHEIMNSVTPISSLASTVSYIADDIEESINSGKAAEIDPEDAGDLKQALHTIHNRSQGLISFVQDFRNLAIIPAPKFRIIPIAELFSRVEMLMEADFQEAEPDLEFTIVPESLELTADPALIEQILINLIKNSIQHAREDVKISIKVAAETDRNGRVEITVEDNGKGITKEALEKIFIPFYTTRPEGSGIGLSLARQIMRMHKGFITVESEVNAGTTFTMRF